MKKSQKVALIVGGCVSLVLVFFLVINLVPKSATFKGENPFKKTDKTLIAAHRGGSAINPEHTEKAFDYCVEQGYDIIELDILKTADNQYVIVHDDSINRTGILDTTESEEVLIAESTYEELRQYNLGVNFKDREGNYPYRDYTLEAAEKEGLLMMKFDDFVEKYNGEDFKLFLELKNDGEDAIPAADYVYNLFCQEKYQNWFDRTMVITFSDVAVSHMLENYQDMLVAPLGNAIIPYIATTALGVSAFYHPNFAGIQFSYSYGPLKLARRDLLAVADQRNIATSYWTINNEDGMEELIMLGTDAITTDSPDILYSIING